MEYKQAHEIAVSIYKRLLPFTTQCDIAGSVRREKPEPKDIEICCVPRITETKDLFGGVLSVDRNGNFIREVYQLGKILKGDVSTGRYVQIALHEGIKLDLFMPKEEAYFLQYAIRTGSKEYSHKVIAGAWLRLGWCGTENGLRRAEECYKTDLGGGKHKWICNSKQPTLPPKWNNEYELFQWLNLTWIEPKKRFL